MREEQVGNLLADGSQATREGPNLTSRQFSLRQLLIVMSAIGALLAVPGGVALIGVLAGWAGVVVAVMLTLIVVQLPFYLLVRLWIRDDD